MMMFFIRVVLIIVYPIGLAEAAYKPFVGMWYYKGRAMKQDIKKFHKDWKEYWQHGER